MFETSDEPHAEVRESAGVRWILLGLWRRRTFLCLMAIVSLTAGGIAGLRFDTRTYSSDTSLLCDPQAFRAAWDRDPIPPPVLTSRVTSPDVLGAAAAHLGMPVATLEKAVTSNLDRDSGALHIVGTAHTPEAAQQIAQAVRSAFVESLHASLVEEKKRDLGRLRARYTRARRAVVTAGRDVQTFLLAHGTTVSDLTAGLPAGAIEQLQLAFTEAQAETNAMQQQLEGVRASMAALRTRAREEQAAAQRAADDAAQERRADTLLAVLTDDRTRQTQAIALRQSEADLERARQLQHDGFISQQELERAREAFDRNRVLLADDPRHEVWRSTKTRLSARSASAPPIASASESLLTQLQTQEQTLRLQLEALQRRSASLRLQLTEAVTRRTRLPALQRRYDEVAHVLSQAQLERSEAQARLSRATQAAAFGAAELPGVSLLSDAELPRTPGKSRGMLIGLAVAGGGLVLSLVLVMLAELRDGRLRAPSQLPSQLSVPVLGTVPRLSRRTLMADLRDARGLDFTTMARRLREQVPDRGARILLLSPGHAEGKSLVACGIAGVLRRQGEKVLVLDVMGPVRDDSCAAPGPLLSEATRRYDVILLEGTALDEKHLDQMSATVDAVILVLENDVHPLAQLRHLVDGLQRRDAPLVGGIVTKVDPIYLLLERLAA